MRHVFILNPVAGKNQTALTLRGKIDAYFSRHPELEYRVRLTDGVGAATRIAREECEMGDPVRLYACGGDGTLQETANGIPVGRDDVELTVIPCGSGNDYVRTFGGSEAFCELADLIEGQAVPVDAVDCGDRISLNIASIGLDLAQFDALYGEKKIDDALKFAKDLKDRYSVLWMYYDLLVS